MERTRISLTSLLNQFLFFLFKNWRTKKGGKEEKKNTWTGLRRERENERRAALASCDGTAERLRLEAPQLLHEVGRLHESHVGKMEVAKDLILEATGALLTGARQVDTAGVTAEAFLVVDVVVVDTRRLCIIHTKRQRNSSQLLFKQQMFSFENGALFHTQRLRGKKEKMNEIYVEWRCLRQTPLGIRSHSRSARYYSLVRTRLATIYTVYSSLVQLTRCYHLELPFSSF